MSILILPASNTAWFVLYIAPNILLLKSPISAFKNPLISLFFYSFCLIFTALIDLTVSDWAKSELMSS